MTAPPPLPWHRELWAQVRAQLPGRAELERHRWLRPVAHRVAERDLWRLKPESLARGVAIGIFWAFVVPVAQIVFAAAHCVWWRGNIPVAAAATLITNPLTIGPWLLLAYQVGTFMLPPEAAALAPLAAEGWLDRLQALGWPAVVGMATFAIGGAALSYALVRAGAWLRLTWRLRRRSQRKAA
jgi:uncharacterized protein (DUF2062 family)